MILVGCRRCPYVFHYSDRSEMDTTCPECGSGPIRKWANEIKTYDEVVLDGGRVDGGEL